ncbi:hypothetical protein V8E51_010813 [Hyaloscypha variabilis]
METYIPLAKRARLSMACNECRRRKVKCDTEAPKCRNCRLRNDTCTTTDPRRPHIAISREWIEQPRENQESPAAQAGMGQKNSAISSQSPPGLTTSTTTTANIGQSSPNTSATAPRGEEAGISPAQQPHEMAFNTDLSSDRIKMMGASSSQCLMKSLDLYLESAGIPPLSGSFRHGMRQAEEMEISFVSSLPTLPEACYRDRYVSAFFDKIHPVYPLFDIDNMKHTIQNLSSKSNFHGMPQDQVPMLVSAYLIASIGADEEAQKITEDGTKYLVAAASLLGQIVFVPYLATVQTLLLFTLVYRGRNKDGVGWQTLGIAIRIAHTLGLHRHSVKNPSSQHGVQSRSKQLFHARIWAICCSLEKMMQLESGRPTMIQDVDRDHMMGPDQHPPGHDFLQWHMGLAQHQGLISHHIYSHKPGSRTAQEILSDTARLDRSLLSWAKELPEEFRPSNDLFCSSHEFHIAAHLSIQYYQTVIALHRAALISPASKFLSEVENHDFDNGSRLRLRASEAICVSSARSIARLAIELSDRNIHSRILTDGPQLLACIVLGISLMKNLGARIMAADLELLKACVEYTADRFVNSGHNALFAKGIKSIYEQVRLFISRKSSGKITPPMSMNNRSLPDADSTLLRRPENETQPAICPNQYNAMEESGNISSNTTTLPKIPEPNTYLDSSTNRVVISASSVDSLPPTLNQDLYSDALPFDDLNVQELWTWMGDLDYDNYSYVRSYENNGVL